MTKPKTRDEMANEYTIHQYKMTFDVPAMHGIQRAYLAGYDAHAAIAKERERRLISALERARSDFLNIGQTAWDGNDELKRALCTEATRRIDKLREQMGEK